MVHMDPLLNALDRDHDGVLSAEEIAAATASLLTLDADHDGILEPAEMRMRQQTPQERVDHVFSEFDTNKDGKLSREEMPDGMRARFADADKNGDGYLDSNELLQMFSTNQQDGTGQPQGEHN